MSHDGHCGFVSVLALTMFRLPSEGLDERSCLLGIVQAGKGTRQALRQQHLPSSQVGLQT